MEEKTHEETWMEPEEIMEIFGCKRTKAYKIIQKLNRELEERNFMTYPGKLSRKYFRERFYG